MVYWDSLSMTYFGMEFVTKNQMETFDVRIAHNSKSCIKDTVKVKSLSNQPQCINDCFVMHHVS